ncbi:MAG: sigma 54-interacting transcriptional regulator [Pseudomonadota bacterium]
MIGRGPSSKRRRARPAEQASTTAPLAGTSPESGRTPLGLRFLHPLRLAQHHFALNRRTLIGRDPASDLVLDDETISRRHAQIEHAGLAYAIRDLDSRNGLFCDGVRTELAQLELGRVVRLGDCVAVVCEHMAHEPGLIELAPELYGSYALARVVELARRAARSNATVLIYGETGTGKELFARLIHEHSGRPGQFVASNCAALAENLLEAELFGHERGAFTGADRARPGLVRQASGGTLFLDEIAELPLAAQAKLLRVLEAHEVLPVGGAQPVPVDLRVVCATHGDLSALVAQGAFRADLYARLEGVTLRLPPLRERRQDIPELFLRFVERYRPGPRPALSATFVEGLCRHDWPRNVRQLRQLAERSSALLGSKHEWRRRDLLTVLPEVGSLRPSAEPPAEGAAPLSRGSRLTRAQLLAALHAANGNVTLAARQLSVAKQTLYKHIALQGIDLAQLRDSTPPERRSHG